MNLKHLLLLSTALSIGLAGWAALADPANAACTSYAPASNTTVTCSGSNTSGISANSTTSNITVILEDGASVSTNTNGISLSGSGNNLELRADSSVSSSSGTAINLGSNGTSGNHLVLHGESFATAVFYAAVLHGSLGSIALYDNSTLKTTGSASAIFINGNYNSIDLNDSSLIQTTGTTNAHGMVIAGSGNTITVDQGASIDANGSAIRINSGASNRIVNYGSLVGDLTAVTGSSSNDILENYGLLVGNSGTAVSLGGGGDTLVLGTGSSIAGNIDGGSGTDTVTLLGTGSEDNNFSNFELLTMAGTEWVLSGTSSFGSIMVDSGILRLNGSITGDVQVEADGTLGGTGTIYGDVTSFGTLSAGNSVGMSTIVGNLVQNGGSFVEFDASGVDRWNVTGTATLVNNPTLTITSLDGSTTAYGVILRADGGITGSFADPPIYDGNGAASILQTADEIILQVVDGTVVVADHHAAIETGLSFFDEVVPRGRGDCLEGEQLRSPAIACGDHFWAKTFGRRGEDDAHDGNKSFTYAIGGMAMGAQAKAAPDVSLGASLGYATSGVEVDNDAGSTNIASILGALNAQFSGGAAFFAISAGGGWQDLDLFRTAAVAAQALEVESDTSALLLGGKLLGGLHFELPSGWVLTPTFGASYLHQWVQGYDEAIGPSAVSIYDHDTGLLRLKAEIEARHSRVMEGVEYSPYLSLGVVDDLARGGTASGAFSSGAGFDLDLDHSDEIRSRAGIGVDATFENGSTASLAYHAEASGKSVAHELAAEIRLLW